MAMKAALVTPFQPIDVKDVALPLCKERGILVQVWYAGVCHTDVHLWTDGYDLPNGGKLKYTERKDFIVPFPAIPGHEISGKVVEIGKSVPVDEVDYKVGDKVVVYPSMGCGDCSFCKRGLQNSCVGDGECEFVGLNIGGGYGEFVLVPDFRYVCRVPDGIPMELACLLPCSGITSFNAVLKGKQAVENAVTATGKATVLIVGLGGLGCWGLLLAKRLYPKEVRIVCADCWQPKLEQSLQDGASGTALWEPDLSVEDCASRALEACGGKADLVLDFVGSTSSLERGVQCLAFGGTVIVVGLYGGSNPIRLFDLVRSNMTVIGSILAGLPILKRLLEELASGSFSPPPITLITLDQVQDALQKLKDRKAIGRSVIRHACADA